VAVARRKARTIFFFFPRFFGRFEAQKQAALCFGVWCGLGWGCGSCCCCSCVWTVRPFACLFHQGGLLLASSNLVVPTEVVAVQEKRFRDRFWLVRCGRFGFACVCAFVVS
jgi:hypothetical protein